MAYTSKENKQKAIVEQEAIVKATKGQPGLRKAEEKLAEIKAEVIV